MKYKIDTVGLLFSNILFYNHFALNFTANIYFKMFLIVL